MATRKRKMTIEDLFRLRVINQASISPDGKQVAVSIKRCNPKKNKYFSSLYLVGARGGRLRRLTRGDHNDTQPKWSPDGRTLAFLSDRDKASCLWLLPMDGGEPTRLTDRDHDVFEFNFSPNGRRIAYTARAMSERDKLRRDGKKDMLEARPDYVHVKRLSYKLDGVGLWNGHYVHLHVVNTGGGKPKKLTRGDFDHQSPQFSPDGRRIAFLSNRRPDPDREVENSDIYTIPANGGRLSQVTKRHGPILNYSWSPDGRSLAYVGHLGKNGEWNLHNFHVWTIPATGGRPRNVTPGLDNSCYNTTIGDIAEVTFSTDPPLWSADGCRVFFTVGELGSADLYGVGVPGGTPEPRLASEQVLIGVSRTAPGGRAALVVGTQTNPCDVFTVNLEDPRDQPRRVTNINGPLLSGLHVAEPEPFACRRRGHTVHGWVLKPPGFSPKKKYPMILQIHGGPHAQYGHVFFHEMQWLAAQGYVVLYTNPRGSLGYGLDYVTRLHGNWGGPDTPDLLACVDQLTRHRFIDKDRLYVTGGSYGGFMTNLITARDHRFRAAVTQRSVANMESMMASDYGWCIADELGCMPWEDPQRYRRLSPVAYAKRIKTPLLIIHSDQDLRCPVNQAEELFATLKYLGKEVEMVRFAGESHGLSRGGRPQNRAERLRRILDWFQRHK